jgi:4'-phosphopantetheinyl transferase
VVDVWWARPVDPATAPGLLALLDDHERARLDRFRRPADRARYLAAHALVRLVVGARTGVDARVMELDRTCRCGEQHGKPRRIGGPEFSLSHSGEWVGVAVGAGEPLGLDVEQLRPLAALDGLAGHALSPTERTRPPSDARTFLGVWTRKEALLKATSDGLSKPMNAITLTPAGDVETWTDGPGAAWVVGLEADPDHPAALAGLGHHPPEVTVHDGDEVLRAAT